MNRIYLDDVRTPVEGNWIVVRNYLEFVDKVNELGLDNIELVSLDHDLGDTAMAEYFNNVSKNYKLDYNNINEKTGYDAAKWLVNEYCDYTIHTPQIYSHSANPIGAANIIGYVNSFLKHTKKKQTAELKVEPFTVKNK